MTLRRMNKWTPISLIFMDSARSVKFVDKEIFMHPYTRHLQTLFLQNANPQLAAPMAKYMRDQFPYLGIKSPLQGELHRKLAIEHGLPPAEALEQVCRDLWNLPEREYQYAACSLLRRMEKQLPAGFAATLEYLVVTKSWWDTVDSLSHVVGTLFLKYPQARETWLPRWRTSDNIWLRRIALLFQLDYKNQTDFALLKEIIIENLGSREFFINKAIGWALRQYSRIDPAGVREFVASTPLHPLSAREALKWLEKRINKELARKVTGPGSTFG